MQCYRVMKNVGVMGRPITRFTSSGPSKAPAAGAAVNTPPYKSAATPNPGDKAVGPGASKSGDYKCAEYYCYNKTSYFDLEAEMVKDRLPQPSADNGRK